MSAIPEVQIPRVSWRELWADIVALVVAVLIPPLFLIFDLADRTPDLFQRGGLVSLFIVAVLQFKALSELNRKHISNALRAKRGETILEISPARSDLSWLTFMVAVYASAISVFGDKLVRALLRALYE